MARLIIATAATALMASTGMAQSIFDKPADGPLRVIDVANNTLTENSFSNTGASDSVEPDPKDADLAKFTTGKWIVRSVKRDGAMHPAQVGQKVGDIITITFGLDATIFG